MCLNECLYTCVLNYVPRGRCLLWKTPEAYLLPLLPVLSYFATQTRNCFFLLHLVRRKIRLFEQQVFQYFSAIQGVASRSVHAVHAPCALVHDVSLALLPEKIVVHRVHLNDRCLT